MRLPAEKEIKTAKEPSTDGEERKFFPVLFLCFFGEVFGASGKSR